MTELAELQRRYWGFAEFEAKDYSPIYWSFATAVAENDRVLERLAALPRIEQQPNLLLAAVRLQHGVAGDADQFCNLVVRHWDEIKEVILAQERLPLTRDRSFQVLGPANGQGPSMIDPDDQVTTRVR